MQFKDLNPISLDTHKLKRGRPKKLTAEIPTSSKKRGRPKKENTDDSLTKTVIRRGRGRPPKERSAIQLESIAKAKEEKKNKQIKEIHLEQKYMLGWIKALTLTTASSTVATYKRSVKFFLDYLVNEYDLELKDVSLDLIQDYVLHRIDDGGGVTPRTLNKDIVALRSYFSYLVSNQESDVVINPFIDYKSRRITKNLPNILSVDEVNMLIDQSAEETVNGQEIWIRDKAILEIFYCCGIRVSELANIRLSDFNIEENKLSVVGKRNKERIVAMGRSAQKAMREWTKERKKWLKNDSDKEHLFISFRFGKKLDNSSIHRIVRHHAARAGIHQKVYPHLLRHCFATHLLESGLNLIEIAKMLGHEDVGTTEIYTSINFNFLAKEYDKAHPRADKS